jgi:hypothetical protein
LINITFTLPLGKDLSVMVHVLQMRSGLLQSSQKEVVVQGVLYPQRKALIGAA